MIYILCFVVYLAIGGFLSGVFDECDIDEFYWYLAWPFLLVIVAIMVLEVPFEKLGQWTLTKIRDIRKGKNK